MSSHLMSDKTLPRVISHIGELRTCIAELRHNKQKLGLVPTMGALHEGHLSLARASRAECDVTIVTIFVNPTQFGPNEDFQKYPRTLHEDLELLSREGVQIVFAPTAEEMYPARCTTWIEPPQVGNPLEGVCRPGHFRGVATVVLKLFHLVPADIAFFGQKDFQQCRVIEQMVRDLNVSIEIRRCPIVREQDGLAMSSRNRYLSAEERHQALAISRCFRTGQQLIRDGNSDASLVRDAMQRVLLSAGITRLDYVAIADPDSLDEVVRIAGPVVLLVAAFVGHTRLIDNCIVG